jgi:hypothetical protein
MGPEGYVLLRPAEKVRTDYPAEMYVPIRPAERVRTDMSGRKDTYLPVTVRAGELPQ